MFIRHRSLAVADQAAPIDRFRKQCGEIARRFAEPCGIDPVIYKWSSQIELLPVWPALRRGDAAKVSGQHRCGGNKTLKVGRILTYSRALESSEEKHLVPADRSAESSTKLIPLQRAVGRREIISRFE